MTGGMNHTDFYNLLAYLDENPLQAKELAGALLAHVSVDITQQTGCYDDLGNRTGPDPISIELTAY